jgi:predicted  nucleic acid-binding Zn-ribbon protein
MNEPLDYASLMQRNLELQSALERKDQKLEKESDILIDTLESMRSWKLRATTAEQKLAELEHQSDRLQKTIDGIQPLILQDHARIVDLEQRLQQPIKLPKREIGMACEFVSDHIVVSLAAVLAEATAAGFKVEGE